MTFEIKQRDSGGRICHFQTKHGTVTTPNLLPVINPNNMVITPKEMKKLFGTEIIITNSYIIHKNKHLKEKALQQGVHKLIDFNGTIMTDSGTFQSYVYGDINIDPIEIVKFQHDIGSDIGTILDIFSTPDQTVKQAQESVKETIKRAKQSIQHKKEMLLACPVQGSIYPSLRKKCAQQLSTIDADFFPIGGVVPLMENQRYTDLVQIILSSKQGLDPSKPVHLFGAGHPLLFPLAVALGCDFFDSSAYIKYANDKRMIFPWGTEKLDDLSELPCCCPICSKTSASELKKIPEKQAILMMAKHNLYVSFAELKNIRTAIHQGSLWELVERRAYSNPYLLESLQQLQTKQNKQWLSTFEPISKKKALFYTGSQSIHRPIIYRIHQRLNTRYIKNSDKTIVLPEAKKPYSLYYSEIIQQLFTKENVNIIIDSSFGPVPVELDEMYPFAQSIVPKQVDLQTKKIAKKILNNYLKTQQSTYFNEKLKDTIPITDLSSIDFFDIQKIKAVANMQFKKHASQALFSGDITLVKSKKTKKIRNIYCNNNHILSMRAGDGLFTLKLQGAYLLHTFFKPPHLRVQIHDDAIPFIKEGKSVFAKFVLDCDPELIPLDECLIVDQSDTLLGVGRCLLNRLEMISFNYGIAVKTREHI
jgi:7-cyano-7-deazaguanine tRNA-ribosyltransferase